MAIIQNKSNDDNIVTQTLTNLDSENKSVPAEVSEERIDTSLQTVGSSNKKNRKKSTNDAIYGAKWFLGNVHWIRSESKA